MKNYGRFMAGAALACLCVSVCGAVEVANEAARLEMAYLPTAVQIPGMRGVQVMELQPYGMGKAAYSVDVKFDEVAPAVAAVRAGALPKSLPESADGFPVYMNVQLPDSTVAAYHRDSESKIKEGLSRIPGVVGVELKEYSAYGPMSGVTDRDFKVSFRDEASLENARAQGLLKKITALKELRNLSREYDVVGEVEAPEAQAARIGKALGIAPAAPEKRRFRLW